MKQRSRPAQRFPLLAYRRLFGMWFWPSLWLLVASAILLALDPLLLGRWRWAWIPLILVTGCLIVYAVMARAAYVCADPGALCIRAPLLPLAISYGSLKTTRTTPFRAQYPPERLSWSQRQLAKSLYGRTCLLIELDNYPVSRRKLALLGRFLFPVDSTGIVLLVENWLQLSHEIEGARAEWVTSRTPRRPERTVERVLRT